MSAPRAVWSAIGNPSVAASTSLSESPSKVEASRAADFGLNRLHRVYLANRGIWEAIVTAGPAVSFAAERSDIDRYLEAFEQLVAAITD